MHPGFCLRGKDNNPTLDSEVDDCHCNGIPYLKFLRDSSLLHV
jgi:hypothetical protein